MTAVIFLGPTLPVAEAEKICPASYFPPAGRGDVYKAAIAKPAPKAIAIIDGLFAQQASVNHKEILWTMAQGIHVFGSSSMGALRAAELAEFGMIGVGQTFEQLKSYEIEDDDEVAIAHGPEDTGYIPLSDAMVDMRAMFKAALDEQVISAKTERLLLQASKDTFYTERTYVNSFAVAMQLGADNAELLHLEAWLRVNCRSQKKADALLLLKSVEKFLASGVQPKTVDYTFEVTEFWQRGLAEFLVSETSVGSKL